MRLQKHIADNTEYSRRKAEELILDGKVCVNDKIAVIGQNIENSDTVAIDGNIIAPRKRKLYIAMNKPKGYITTTNDEQNRQTVIDLIKNEIPDKIYPVGRLDKDTTGLLFLTNDGDFANKVINSAKKTSKEYVAITNKEVTKQQLKELEQGIILDGIKLKPCKIKRQDKCTYYITIYEGKNRQIRKMFEQMGVKVIELTRIKIGKIALGNIPLGRYRKLSMAEIKLFD